MPVHTRTTEYYESSDSSDEGGSPIVNEKTADRFKVRLTTNIQTIAYPVKVIENMTMTDILANKRMVWTKKSRNLIIYEASIHQFCAHDKPTVDELYALMEKIGMHTTNIRAFSILATKTLTFIKNNVNQAKLGPALYEHKVSNGVWQCYWRVFTADWTPGTVEKSLGAHTVEDWTLNQDEYRARPAGREALSDAKLAKLVTNMHAQALLGAKVYNRERNVRNDTQIDVDGKKTNSGAKIRDHGNKATVGGKKTKVTVPGHGLKVKSSKRSRP